MKKIFTILSLLIAITCNAQDSIKVLFIGNSYTYFENMPDLFSNIADSAGYKVKIQMYAPGGVSVGDISQGTQAHMNNPAVYENIRSDKWDYVVLQDNQGRFVLDYGHFPSSSLVIQGHLQIRDSVLKNNPCAKLVWFAGWGTKNGMPPYGNSGIEMIDRIAANYLFLNDTAHQIIAPIGGAWKRIILTNPAYDLFSPDEMHPSLFGAFLTASVIYTAIFRDNPLYSTANGGLSAAIADSIKLSAWQTLTDSFPATNLQSITPELQWQNSQLTTGTYQHYYWYQDMQWISAANSNTLNVSQSGHYFLMAENAMGCKLKSVSQHIIINDILEHNSNDDVSIYPNPVKTMLNIDITTTSIIFVYDANGKQITSSENIKGRAFELDVSHFLKGLYFIRIQTNNYIIYRKFIKE